MKRPVPQIGFVFRVQGITLSSRRPGPRCMQPDDRRTSYFLPFHTTTLPRTHISLSSYSIMTFSHIIKVFTSTSVFRNTQCYETDPHHRTPIQISGYIHVDSSRGENRKKSRLDSNPL
ncbi:hypothetical protein EVAR_52703_1 [Eumeta japonica]|uniref:Uncharacterized protein n=1 Tax=Eumeta variegata TaxID=151549 RepID=A0A4C1XZH8_EUMVA|nr:hypothetical protein EVAR_52703_1 [Eumeta japonica]